MSLKILDNLDIIIYSDNDLDNIKVCIQSLSKNTKNFNLIIVDSNSKDGSIEYFKSQNLNHLITSNKKIGKADAINYGIRSSNNKWIAIIDSSCIINDSSWLEKLSEFTIDTRVGIIEACINFKSSLYFSGLSFCLINRQCLNEIGYFDKYFLLGWELDFFTRIEWSWWKTVYSFDTDLKIKNPTSLEGCMETDINLFRKNIPDILLSKYNKSYLEKTLIQNIWRRNNKRKQFLLGENY